MEFGPTGHETEARASEERRVAALVHHHRNQIQTMASLVGLFGRQMPQGAGREAFEDRRERLEGLSFVSFDGFDEAVVSIDLADLVGRETATLDPERRREIVVTADVVEVAAAHGALLAQLLTELLIDLVTNGFGEDDRSRAEALIERLADGGIRLAGRPIGTLAPPDRKSARALGRALADSLARSLGGSVARGTPDGFWFDAVIPSPQGRR